jgi:hypothetical protein
MPAKQLEQIAAEIQRLSDIEAISQLKARQLRLVDTKQWEAWGKEVMAEDFQLHSDGGITEGRANVIASVSKALAEATTVHRIHPGEIVITGPDTASAIWPMDDYVTLTHKGAPMAFRGYGYYHDDYVRTEQGWRIKSTKLVRQRVDTERG